MSLTSYRAAPPRGVVFGLRQALSDRLPDSIVSEQSLSLSVCQDTLVEVSPAAGGSPLVGLAATCSPTVRTAVPWARRGFTVEFGMGSCGSHAL